MQWIKASERLPTKEMPMNFKIYDNPLSGEFISQDGDDLLIRCVIEGQYAEQRYFPVARVEWLDESQSPVDRGVEKAEDYAAIRYPFVALEEKSLVADNAIIEACRNAYIAGAKLAGNDAVEFAEWCYKNYFPDYSTFLWYKTPGDINGKPSYTTEQLYNLFKQKQL